MEVFSRVLVAVDGSPPSDAAVRLALQVSASAPHPSLRFISVFEPAVVAFGVAPETEEAACRRALDAACAAARGAGIEPSATRRDGHPAAEILAESEDWNASCTVIGTHGRRGIARAIFGSCAEGVLHRTTRPVLVVRETQGAPAGTLDRLLCAFDGSAAARSAFEAAAALAAERDAELHLLSVVQVDDFYASGYERDAFDPDGSIGQLYDDARQTLAALAASVSAGGVRVVPHVVGGTDVATIVVACAARYGCGLIVMGTHGRRGIAHAVLGSTAESVIRNAAVPALVFHQPRGAPTESAAPPLRQRSR